MNLPHRSSAVMLRSIERGFRCWAALIAFAVTPRLPAVTVLSSVGNSVTLLRDSGTLEDGDEFSYPVAINQAGTLHVYSTGSTDTYGHLANGGRVELVADDNSGTGSNFDLSYPVSPGTYYVRVHGYAYKATGKFGVVADFAPSAGASGRKTASAMRAVAAMSAGSSEPGTVTAMSVGNTVPAITGFSVSPSSVSPGGWVHIILTAHDPDDNMNAYAIRHVGFGSADPAGIGAMPNNGTNLSRAFDYHIPVNAPTGSNTFRAEVGDTSSIAGNAATYAIQELQITVLGTPVNAPPNAMFNDGPLALPVAQSGAWTYSASDTNGNLARWRFGVGPFTSTNPAWVPISGGVQVGAGSMSFPAPGPYTLRLEVEDDLHAATTVERVLTVTALAAPAITSAGTASGAYGVAFNDYSIAATNAPTSYSASGLPPGLSLAGAAIVGTPSQGGVYAVTINASNSVGTGSATLTFTITTAVLTANVSMSAVVVRPISGSSNQNIQLTGFSSLGNLTHYKYTIFKPDGTTQELIDWTPFSMTTTPVWVAEGHWGYVLEPSGYPGQVWTDSSYYGQVWVSDGYYEYEWADGYWCTYYYTNGEDPSQDGWRDVWQEGFGYYNWVDDGHWSEGWVDNGYWSDGWIDTSTEVYEWIDTSHWGTQPAVQQTSSGSATINEPITPGTALGGYTVILDIKTAANQTLSVWKTYLVSLPAPAIISPAAATGTVGLPFGYSILGTNSPTSYSATGLPAGLALNSATGVISGTPTQGGNFTVTAGATNAAGTGLGTLALSVNKGSQSITFGALPNRSSTDMPFTLSASATSLLQVAFAVVSGPATILGSTVTLSGGTGSVTIRASQGGNGNYNAAPPIDQVFTVSPAPPVVTSQPQSQTVPAGSAATLSVTATGAAPLTYQWKKTGADISGATSSIIAFSNIQAADAAAYTVVVTNGGGSVTSNVATLTILQPPIDLQIHRP